MSLKLKTKRTSSFFISYFTVLTLVLVLGLTSVVSAATLPNYTTNTLEPQELTSLEQTSLTLINRDRARYGIAPLKSDPYLNALAQKRAEEMIAKKRISHVLPTLGSPWTSLKQYNISYRTASENLQYGARTPYEAHLYLMQSFSHRTSILRRDFNNVGLAIVPNGYGGYLQVQLFVGR
ncbi:MAG TPA: hypothetical protein GX522_02130 [Firmicutes bacterium]|nr:hypothetical protein [Bacillota bacterium]